MKPKETLEELKSMPIEAACCLLLIIATAISIYIGAITTQLSVIIICAIFALYVIITIYRVCNGINEIGKGLLEMQKTFQEINSVE